MNLDQLLATKGRSIRELMDWIAATLRPLNNDAIFISGSLAEGLGTPTSDIDVFHIVSSPSEENYAYTVSTWGVPVDIEVRSQLYVERTLAAVAATPLRSNRDALLMSRDDLDFVNRLRHALPVTGGHRVKAWIDLIDLASLENRLTANRILAYRSMHSDLCGFLDDADDLGSARYLVAILHNCVMHNMVVMGGSSNINEKWSHRIFARQANGDPFIAKINLIMDQLAGLVYSGCEIEPIVLRLNLVLLLFQLKAAKCFDSDQGILLADLIAAKGGDRIMGAHRAIFLLEGYEFFGTSVRSGMEIAGNWRLALATFTILLSADTISSLSRYRSVLTDDLSTVQSHVDVEKLLEILGGS